jgi:hypothetical protein
MHGINNVKSLKLLWKKYRCKPEAIEEHYKNLCHYNRRSKRIHLKETEVVCVTPPYSVVVLRG